MNAATALYQSRHDLFLKQGFLNTFANGDPRSGGGAGGKGQWQHLQQLGAQPQMMWPEPQRPTMMEMHTLVFPQLGQIKLKCGNHSGPLKLGKVPQ
jgi:hypothetical protein